MSKFYILLIRHINHYLPVTTNNFNYSEYFQYNYLFVLASFLKIYFFHSSSSEIIKTSINNSPYWYSVFPHRECSRASFFLIGKKVFIGRESVLARDRRGEIRALPSTCSLFKYPKQLGQGWECNLGLPPGWQGPTTWSITQWVPGCTLTEILLGSRAWTQTQPFCHPQGVLVPGWALVLIAISSVGRAFFLPRT